jgi:phage tail sheath gpL-like
VWCQVGETETTSQITRYADSRNKHIMSCTGTFRAVTPLAILPRPTLRTSTSTCLSAWSFAFLPA